LATNTTYENRGGKKKTECFYILDHLLEFIIKTKQFGFFCTSKSGEFGPFSFHEKPFV
jgi:hypothetical protein